MGMCRIHNVLSQWDGVSIRSPVSPDPDLHPILHPRDRLCSLIDIDFAVSDDKVLLDNPVLRFRRSPTGLRSTIRKTMEKDQSSFWRNMFATNPPDRVQLRMQVTVSDL